MKKIVFPSIIMPLSLLVLSIHCSATSSIPSLTANVYTEKKTASEFWADFKQDSKQTWEDSKSAFKDGWIEGKLATAISLNKHLKYFKIDVHVDNNLATLEGDVFSDIEKELAENIALGVEGIDLVSNKLKITGRSATTAQVTSNQGRNFSQYVEDLTTTAAIKTELLASKNINGLDINVDTLNDKVTLSGKVKSLEEKALAQAIAAKHNDVKGVFNNLHVDS